MVLKGNIYTIEITDVSTSGEGIGRAESMVVFVPGTVPGDTADVEIAEVKKNIARGTQSAGTGKLRQCKLPVAI